jgi:uncharacterized membrane protein YbhN (UPF0104 family)
LLYAFNFDLPFWGAMVILIINTVLIMIPLSPGNLGTFQFACILGLSFFGVHKAEALSFSLVLHVIEIVPVALLGMFYLIISHTKLEEYQASSIEPGDDGADNQSERPSNNSPTKPEPEQKELFVQKGR